MRIFGFLFTLFFTAKAMAFSPMDLRSFGQGAPVQLYLFTSLTCPHCADFHKTILPTLKKEYADTGKAQIIIVDMVTPGNGLMATQTLRCLDTGAADKFEKDLYGNQFRWMHQETVKARRLIREYATRQGMTSEQFNMCLANKELQASIVSQQANLARLYGVRATPTLVMRSGAEVRKWAGADKKIFKELKEAFEK